MNIWKRWLGGREAATTQSTTRATCPYCGAAASESQRKTLYPLWESACGAIGSGSCFFADLDEVGDELLATLGIGGSVSEPSVPVGDSLSLQHYDIPGSLARLQRILLERGYEMQTNQWVEAQRPNHCIWVRRVIQ